ncbi:N-lysine methyltransferase SMYD2 [Phytophthora citrophthora]|uniref:N-lysine methyltransferase SMYD2 n=1 Tax=Phytophthora citrophthora TaxID=4793 RepID=A0AAD9LMS6_9STRA|nr:N-lysine methyltransferase SMYD2 [Phytophthora citrophthora]
MAEQFLWRVDRDATRGRLLRATRDVKTGESVLRDVAYGNVVLSANRTALCAVCLRAADADICCDDCSRVFFCSEECQEKLQDVHEKECEALEEVDLVASKTSTDVNLLRLLIRILAVRSQDAMDGKRHMDEEGNVASSYANVKELVHVLDKEGGPWVDHVRAGAKKILEDLPDECQLPVEEILVIAAQINENAYSLDALDGKHLVAAVGLFPICGLINHSCQPNCTWSNAGGSIMEVRALCDIKKGEEITLSYIDIDKERSERQKELQNTKHFDCQCDRCSTPLNESVDRFLQGFRCPRCSLKADEDKDCLLIQVEEKLVCPDCQFNVSAAAIVSATLTARSKVDKAKQSLNQFKYVDVVSQLAGFTKGIEVRGQAIPFHRSHSVSIAVTRLLSDAHFKLGNVIQAYEFRRQLLKALQLVSWRNHLPLALAHFDYAEALRRMVMNPTTPLPENLNRDDLQQQMRASYQAFSDICSVCLGKLHPLRHQALAAVKF